MVLELPRAHRGSVPQRRRTSRSASSSPARAAAPLGAARSARSSCRRSTRSRWRSRRCTPTSARSCELGGQDAKIIIFKKNEETGRQDRHHLDERQVRVGHRRHHRQVRHQGRPAERGGRQDRASTTRKLHHVAAKCGVFAETDIVNLVKSGIPSHRDHELAGRRHRHAEPVGADARQHAAPQGAAARRPEHLPAVPAATAGASASPRPGASAATTIPRTCRSKS